MPIRRKWKLLIGAWAVIGAWNVAVGSIMESVMCMAIVYSLWTGSNNVGFLMTGWNDGDSRYEMKLMKAASWGIIVMSVAMLGIRYSTHHEPGPDIAFLLSLGVGLGIIPAVFTLYTLSDQSFHDFMEGRYIARLEAKIDAAE